MRLPGGGGMSVKEFLSALKDEYSRDNVGDSAAAVTYAGVMALFPFLLFLVSLASVVIQPSDAERIVTQLGSVAPEDVTRIVGERIRALGEGQSPGLLTVGALGAIWAASAGIQALMRALNVVYGVRDSRPFWKVKGIAILMTFVAGVLALLALVVAIVSAPIARAVGGPIGTAIEWLRLPVAGLMMMLMWATLYHVLPDVEQKFKFITPGSVGGVVLWVLASWGFSEYVANFGKYDATYGSVGGIIVMLLWMWISSQVLLLGAEANAIIEHRSHEGKRAGAKSLSESGPSATKSEELGPTAAWQATREGQERPGARRGSTSAAPPPTNGAGGVLAWVRGRGRGADGGSGHPRFDATSIAGLVAGAVLLRLRRAPR